MPMDESLAVAAIDLGGRPFCVVDARLHAARVGDFQTELVEDFFQGFAQAARANVHLRVLYGRSRIIRWKRCSRRLRERCVLR